MNQADAQEALSQTAKQMAFDVTAADRATSADQLRGIEGDAANRYFQALRHMIAPQIEGFAFKQRSRRPPLA